MATTGKVKGVVQNLVTLTVDGPVAQNEICYITPGGNFRTPYDRTRTKHKLTYRKRVPSINKYPLKQSAAAGNQISDGRYICLLQLWAKSVRLIVCVS